MSGTTTASPRRTAPPSRSRSRPPGSSHGAGSRRPHHRSHDQKEMRPRHQAMRRSTWSISRSSQAATSWTTCSCCILITVLRVAGPDNDVQGTDKCGKPAPTSGFDRLAFPHGQSGPVSSRQQQQTRGSLRADRFQIFGTIQPRCGGRARDRRLGVPRAPQRGLGGPTPARPGPPQRRAPQGHRPWGCDYRSRPVCPEMPPRRGSGSPATSAPD